MGPAPTNNLSNGVTFDAVASFLPVSPTGLDDPYSVSSYQQLLQRGPLKDQVIVGNM